MSRDPTSFPALSVYASALLPSTWSPAGDALIFSARQGDSTNLMQTGISRKTWKATGRVQRLTSGTASELSPVAASNAGSGYRVAFASVAGNSDIWSLVVSPNEGAVKRSLDRLTNNVAGDFATDISPGDGRLLFGSNRSGISEAWLKDLRTNEETPLNPHAAWRPLFSPDGSRLSYSRIESAKWNIYVAPSPGSTGEKVCDDCGQASSWSPDGQMLAYNDMEGKVGVVELASRRRTVLLAHKDYRFYDPRFSPDGRWIALLGPSGVLIVPFALKPIPEEEWISVGAGGHPQWSPDGRLLYFILPHDGYRCIGAQRLGPSQRPIGLSLPIYHDHTTRRSLGGFVVGRDKLFLSITERTGNIWMAEWK